MRRLPQLTDRIRLGGSKLSVSPICLGAVHSERTIAVAFDAGINCFFLTADMHWPIYEASRRGLRKLIASSKAVRDEIVVVVACYVTQPDFCSMPFDEVIQSIEGLGRVDIAVMGGVYAGNFMPRLTVFEEHRRLRRFGVRAIGATFHERQLAPTAVTHGLVDMAFIRYNPAHVGARDDVFPHLPRASVAPLFSFLNTGGYVSQARRLELGIGAEYWQPALTDYYRFALTRPQIRGLLCAPQTPREMTALARAIEKGPLTSDEEQFLVDLARIDAGKAALVTSETGRN